ncbi:hypothetical protein BpHYR1_021142 [Brachionus plicatilis]|uniref:Uncharacterized protein n=1 Tax=Brachionus plicatilis TaxID=10195 RepID=A0A3M7PBH2_BRAPC|nr:hypothetical protein BpHYR1_021142 [Brachionus plicatilis]
MNFDEKCEFCILVHMVTKDKQKFLKNKIDEKSLMKKLTPYLNLFSDSIEKDFYLNKVFKSIHAFIYLFNQKCYCVRQNSKAIKNLVTDKKNIGSIKSIS